MWRTEEGRVPVLHERLLLRLTGDPEHDDVVVPLSGLGIESIRARVAEEHETLSAHMVDGVAGRSAFDRHVRHGAGQIMHVLHPRPPIARHVSHCNGRRWCGGCRQRPGTGSRTAPRRATRMPGVRRECEHTTTVASVRAGRVECPVRETPGEYEGSAQRGFGHQEASQADGEEEAPQAAEADADPASPRRQVAAPGAGRDDARRLGDRGLARPRCPVRARPGGRRRLRGHRGRRHPAAARPRPRVLRPGRHPQSGHRQGDRRARGRHRRAHGHGGHPESAPAAARR